MIAFIFADLIVLPIIQVYRKYYGTAYTVRIVALMFVTVVIVTVVIAALVGSTAVPAGVGPT